MEHAFGTDDHGCSTFVERWSVDEVCSIPPNHNRVIPSSFAWREEAIRKEGPIVVFAVNVYEYRVANKTITDIIQVVRDLCKIIGGPFVEKECNIILDSMDNILKWIGSGDNSTLICEKLHYCNTTIPHIYQTTYISQNTHKKIKNVFFHIF